MDFLSLDTRKKIGYNSKVKPGKRSDPCWDQYAAKSFFTTPLCATPCSKHHAALLRTVPTRSREYRKRHEKPANELATPWTKSLPSEEIQEKNSSKLKERSGNVYENKGEHWRTRERSGNVYENKGT
jgi:hypothetical protein